MIYQSTFKVPFTQMVKIVLLHARPLWSVKWLYMQGDGI